MEPVYKNLGKVRPTIDNNNWSIDNKYDLLTIVYDPSSNKSYISRKDVPANVVIDNREYWLPFGVGRFVDNAIININYLDGVSQELVTYTLEEAIARIGDEDKRLGVIISFYGNEASDSHTPGWCLYQFMSDDLNDWDDVDAWNSIYYNRNKNVGWFRTESELLAIYPSPHKGDYCYIGLSLISSLVYRCYENGTWVNTHELASANIGITIGGDIRISENGTWVVDDEDTGIKAVGTGVEKMTYTPSQEDGGTNILQVKLTDGTQFSFPIKNGNQGNSGIVVSDLETFLAELVNNLTTDDGTKALSAAQGVVLDNKISQLGQFKSYNYSKNDYVNSLVREIHIDGAKDSNLKYFVRSCIRDAEPFGYSPGFYFAIQSYNPSTQERQLIALFENISKSATYSYSNNGFTTKIIVTLENKLDNTDCLNAVDYAEEYEINDICWSYAPSILMAFDYQIIKNDSYSSLQNLIQSVSTDRRNRPTIVVYKGIAYVFIGVQYRQYSDQEWNNLSNWFSVLDLPYNNQIISGKQYQYVNLYLKELRLISGNLGEGYVYYIRSCYMNGGQLYVGMKARNINTSEETTVFDNNLHAGYNKVTKHGHTWECVVNFDVVINNNITTLLQGDDYSEDTELNGNCLNGNNGFLISLYKAIQTNSTAISALSQSIWVNGEHTKYKMPYSLAQGYYNDSGEIITDYGYKSVKNPIPCKKGDLFLFDNMWNRYDDSSMAFWIYDSQMAAIGGRVDKNMLTADENGNVIYQIDRDGAAYIGLSTDAPNPQNIFFLYNKASEQLLGSLKNDDSIGKVVDVIIFMGQSNMAGRGVSTTTYPEKAPLVNPRAGREFRAITDPTKLYPIIEPFGVDENNPNGINDNDMKTGTLVPAFVNAYFAETNIPIIAISASEGGTNITQWQTDGILLPDAIQRFNDCISYLEKNYYTIRHKYMAWCQGENDATRVSTWKDSFMNVFNAMKNVGVEKCLLIRIGRNSTNTEQDGIIEVQTQMCKEEKDVIMVSTGFAEYAGQGTMKDTQHFYQFAYNEVGGQAGYNSGVYSNKRAEVPQYDCMTQSLYYSFKCL